MSSRPSPFGENTCGSTFETDQRPVDGHADRRSRLDAESVAGGEHDPVAAVDEPERIPGELGRARACAAP